LIHLIIAKGQKPHKSWMEKAAGEVKNIRESDICFELQEIVFQCWETDAKDRPKISDVKQRLDKLAQNQQIYDKAIDDDIKSLIERRKLKRELPVNKKATLMQRIQSSMTQPEVWIPTLAIGFTVVVIYKLWTRVPPGKSSFIFLGQDGKVFLKSLGKELKLENDKIDLSSLPNIIKFNRKIYPIYPK